MYTIKNLLYALALSTPIKAWPTQSFKTEPFTPPVFDISKSGADLAPGLLFITPTTETTGSAVIMTDNGDLVWSSDSGDFTNFVATTLDYEPILTYWSGSGTANVALAGHGYGMVHILDLTYTEIYTVCPNFGLVTLDNEQFECQADLHESYVTERGSIVVSAYNLTQADLTAVGGPADGWVWDSLFFDVDIKTGKTLFSWSALDAGISITDTKQPLSTSGNETDPYDWFHVNSVQSVGTSYLVNGRNVWTTYMVDSTGKIQWRLEVGPLCQDSALH